MLVIVPDNNLFYKVIERKYIFRLQCSKILLKMKQRKKCRNVERNKTSVILKKQLFLFIHDSRTNVLRNSNDFFRECIC